MSRTRRVEKRILPSGVISYRAPYIDSAGARRSRNFPTRKEAQAFLLTVGGELRLGVHTPASNSPTVAEAGALWLDGCARRGLEELTIANYREHLTLHILPLLGAIKLSALTHPMVNAFADQLHAAGRSASMVKRVIVSLSAIFKESRRLGLVASAPTVGVVHKKTDRDNLRAVVPTKTELTAIITAAAEHGPFWRAFILTAIFAGLRASELRGLRWSDVDPAAGTIRVTQRADAKGRIGKCKSQAAYRTIPIPTEACEALRIWRLQCPHGEPGLVFPNSRGGVFNYRNLVRRGFEPIQLSACVVTRQGDALVAKYGLHSLRHSCASLWIESGFNPKKIMALMGHSSIKMTYDVYGHLFVDTDADQRGAARVQSALLGG